MARPPTRVNNALYDELGEKWFTGQDHPVALLRAEGKLTQDWVLARLAESGLLTRNQEASPLPQALDIGCGCGFAMVRLAEAGVRAFGVDFSETTLQWAHARAAECHFARAHAYRLPFADASFELVVCLDFLEHVEDPAQVIREASRVLKPGGLFFFHTFNRTPIAYVLAAKGLEWVVRNTPKHLHVWRLFLKPAEVESFCSSAGLACEQWTGLRPHWLSMDFLRLLLTGRVPETFRFRLTKSRAVSYLGMARKA